MRRRLIILCSQKNEAIVKYSVLNDAQQIFASRYRFALPTAEELQQEIEAERRRIEDEEGCANFQINQHMAFQDAVIKHKIKIKILIFITHQLLSCYKTETAS